TNNISNSSVGAIANNGSINADLIKSVQGLDSEDIRQVVEKVLALLAQLDSKKATQQGQELLADVTKNPNNKPVWNRLVDFLKSTRDGVDAASDLSTRINGILGDIGNLPDLAGLM